MAQMKNVLMDQRDALVRTHQQRLHEIQTLTLRPCNEEHAGNIRSLRKSAFVMPEEHGSDIRMVRDRLEQVLAAHTRQQATALDAIFCCRCLRP